MTNSLWRACQGVFCLAFCVPTPSMAANTAVLPFGNRTAGQSTLDWIGEGIAETIRDAIDSRGGIAIAREDIDQTLRRLGLRPLAPLTQATALKVAESLDAEQLVVGSYEFIADSGTTKAGPKGTLKISARVFVHGRTEQSRQFEESGSMDDLGSLEARVAWRTLNLALPQLAPPESESRNFSLSPRLDAQESYVRGLLAKDLAMKEQLFQQAARLDPRFGHPCWELGQISYERAQYRQVIDWLKKVDARNVHYRDASFLLGLALYQTNDYAGAQNVFQTLSATVPLPEVFNNLGAALSHRDQYTQAAEAFKKALDGDARDSAYQFNAGYALWKKGDFTGAANLFRAAVERDPDDQLATLLLGYCLKKQGPRPGITLPKSPERLKYNFDERAWRQLKSMLEGKPDALPWETTRP